ncbi:MAG: hypothetical protein HYR48_05280 [Gemmatimonadetes bacterium]|nr:hypothetical protein [Gemmatimonadota bacterium]
MSEIRHGTTEELLALRDGEGGAWIKAHVEACATCAGELYRLDQMRARLKALPTFAPPRDRWPLVATLARVERRRRRIRGAVGLATAAALTLLTVVALRPHGAAGAAAARTALQRAMAQSAAMEQSFRAMSPGSRALPGDAAGVVADLEDRLSSIDEELAEPGAWRTDPDRVIGLWQQRAGVLSALVDVHATRVGLAGL